MRFGKSTAFISTYFAVSAQALPTQLPTYSVIDVDGGSSEVTSVVAAPITVYQTVTKSSGSQASQETVSVTVIETPSTTPTGSSSSSLSTAAPYTTISTRSDATSANMVSSTASVTVSRASGPGYAVTVQPSAYTISSNMTSSSSTSTSSTSSSFSTITITSAAADSTVTIVSVSLGTPTASSTSYYDDGMWHTRYPVLPHPVKPRIAQPAL